MAAVALDPHDLSFKLSDIESVINSNTKGIIICTPNNPTGKVYTREELLSIGALAEKHNLWVITDEIYEYITYDNFQHISFASLKKFKDRTITISGFSKTYNMTGWRLGYACGPADIIEKMALVQDLIYVCPATPLQHAALSALHLQAKYYVSMNDAYTDKRKLMVTALRNMGFEVAMPQGAYYLMADFSKLNLGDDISAQTFLLEQAKVATVAGRYFYHIPNLGQKFLRFCYALDEEKLTLAMQQIAKSLKINATRKLEWV